MYGGTLGKWRVETSSSAPTAAMINAVEKEGYELAFICCYDSNSNAPDFFAYYRYRGGRHPNATR